MLTVVNFAATQFIAAKLRHQPALGEPLIRTKNGGGIYQPLAWIIWGWHNSTSLDPRVRKPLFLGEMMVFAGSVLSMALFFVLANRRARRLMENSEDLHGSARWAAENASGIHSCPSAGKADSPGTTPITVIGRELTVMVRPMTDASPPNRACQSESASTTTSLFPGSSSRL